MYSILDYQVLDNILKLAVQASLLTIVALGIVAIIVAVIQIIENM